MTEAVANINEDLAIPYSYKKQILSTYKTIVTKNPRLKKTSNCRL
jgi:hypothetical protein